MSPEFVSRFSTTGPPGKSGIGGFKIILQVIPGVLIFVWLTALVGKGKQSAPFPSSVHVSLRSLMNHSLWQKCLFLLMPK